MRKLYILCGVMSVLIALCAVFLMVQPYVLPFEESTYSEETTVPPLDEPPDETTAAVSETTVPTDTTETPPDVEEPVVMPEGFSAAAETNPDVYAWIRIPGTNIDFPIVQSPTSDSYYLRRGLDRDYLTAGCIMTEHSYNTTTFEDPVTVIYGHAMESGAMFGKLQSYYADAAGLAEHRTIEIYLPGKRLKYSVFAAIPYDRRHILYNYDFSDPDVYSLFFRSVFSTRTFNATLSGENAPVLGDRIIILSTCLMGDSSHRFLVMAKLEE